MNADFTLFDITTGDIKQTVSAPANEKSLYEAAGFGVVDGLWNAATHRVDVGVEPPVVVPKEP